MSEVRRVTTPGRFTEVTVDQPKDKSVQWLTMAILGVTVLVITVVLYGIIAGVINPPAPRTAVEFAIIRAEAAVKAKPGSGQDWADYVTLLLDTGDVRGAKSKLKKAQRFVKDDTRVYINNVDIAILISEGKMQQAYDRTEEYLAFDAAVRGRAIQKYGARGIVVPPETLANQNRVTADLLTYRARAAADLKKYKEALQALDFALEASPGSADILVLRGAVHLTAGDKKSAKADYKEALKYIPDYQPALDGLKQLGVKVDESSK